MNSLNQYLDLYKEHRSLIDSNSAHALNILRSEAFSRLSDASLPKQGAENYELSDLNRMLSPDYGLNIARVPIDVNPAASFRCDVPNLSTSLFMLLNDSWAEAENARANIPEGVIVDSLRHAAHAHPELFERYYGKAADLNNPLVSLNTMLAQDGLFLYVPKGVRLEKPLQLVNILQNGAPLMALRRLLIVIEDEAEAKMLVCDHTQNPDIDFLTLQTVEIFVGERASFDIYDMEESTLKTSRLSSLYLRQQAGSKVLIDSITLFNGTTRNEFHCSLLGKGAYLRLLGMVIGDRNRQTDNYSMIRHEVPDCHSDELFKYTLDDEAKGAFTGRIYVQEDASGTEAYQSNKNMLGSQSARMLSKPQLEIYNDDVKCSHGTAIGQLDPMQLFYMRTRGLSEATARLLLKQAFMADVVDGVRLPSLRDRLFRLVEKRLSGAESLCRDCSSGCFDQNK